MTTRRVLLDSSFVIAALDTGDVHHARAESLRVILDASATSLLLPDLVVIEAAGVLQRRAEQRRLVAGAADALNALRQQEISGPLTHVSVLVPQLLPVAWVVVSESSGALNLMDGVLVAYMRLEGIFEIASFDKDFDGIEGITRVG